MKHVTAEKKIAALVVSIRERFPGSDTTVERFPSGAFTINVRVQGRLFELTVSESQGFGIDEVTADDGFNSGYAFGATTFEQAAEILVSLLVKSRAPS